jgi:GrpB-like predicted nucleotidyltransferase (UPF0157 family)
VSTVAIVPYDPAWPSRFASERALLRSLLGEAAAAIEHVGSTAVPGLSAKPVIDIALGMRSLGSVADWIPAFRSAGYEFLPRFSARFPGLRYFHKGPPELKAFHLHVVKIGANPWRRHLLFREHLRAHPDLVAEYEELKRRLAAAYPDDRPRYTAAKADFIDGVIRRARAHGAVPEAATGDFRIFSRSSSALSRIPTAPVITA